MLQDMGHPGVVWRIGLEPNREYIVLVISRNVHILGTSLIMLQMQRCQLELRYVLSAFEGEAMELLPRFRIIA